MEEVDSIILHFLRELNVSIEDSVRNICDLSVEKIIESASACITNINRSYKVPTKLPLGITHKIEVATQLASTCKDLGYKNDVGYQTFLYYNENELRQVFMFLIEHLPNEGKHPDRRAECINKKSFLKQNISNKINEELQSIWIPPCCSWNSQKIGDFINKIDAVKSINISLSDKDLLQKLMKITQNSQNKDAVKSQESEDKHDQLTNKNIIQKTLKELKESSISLRQKFDTLVSEKNAMEMEYSQAQKTCNKAEMDLKNVQSILSSIGLSEDESRCDSNELLEKVQNNIHLLHKKSEDITSKNISLKIDIESLKNSSNFSNSDRNRCRKTLSNLKETAKSMKDEFEKKEDLRNQLKQNYAKLRVGNKRTIYTKRILEIISNVDKQNMEIKKILDDTRQIQKEINTLEGQLDRCFSIADETLFRDAKKDDQAKKAYKLLALLHSECNTIVSLVNETGTLARVIVDLEENIKTESAKKTEDTLKKVHDDLTKMQAEC